MTAQKAKGQEAVVTGKVTNEHGAAISNASVFIKALNLGANTNDVGNYTITIPAAQAHGQQVVVTARFIGYSPLDEPVSLSAGPHTANFSLKADPFQLNAVVATGVADSTSAKNLTFSMARVTGDQVKDVPAANPIEALAGKVAGAKISVGEGNPGGTPAIRLRGSTCLQVGCSAPLVIIDGVITTEGIRDLDAQDIASIEVLKGAAGASFYGSNAANGVINITTNRGKDLAEGHVSITAHTEYGNSSIQHFPAQDRGTRAEFNPDGSIILVNNQLVRDSTGFQDQEIPATGPNHYRNQLQTWLTSQSYYNNLVSLGLRRANTNFNSSFSSNHNGGVLPLLHGQFQQNARLNVDQGIGAKADMSASVTYTNQHNDFTEGNTDGATAFFSLYQASPYIDLQHPGTTSDTTSFFPLLPTWSDPNARVNPLWGLATNQLDFGRDRLLGSVNGRYRPTDWLRLEGTYGTDRLDQFQQSYTPRGTLNANAVPTNGSLSEFSAHDISWNSQLRGTATKLYRSVLSTTSAAYQMENETDKSVSANGSKLNVNGVPNLGAADPTQVGVGSGFEQFRTTDYMVSQSFDIKDRYIVDGLYRRDGSSLFGPNSRWSNFYRVSGAYRVTQDFHIPGVQELKLHVARGTAGLRPQFNYQFETYNIGNGNISPNTLGNKNLKPAVLTETEYGINADFLDRFSGELTYADRLTKDAFLQVPLSKALTGGFSSQWQNAADIASKTTEGSLQTRLVDRRSFTYDLTLTGDHTTQSIVSMNRAPFRVSATGSQGQNVFWYQPGLPLGIMYGQKFVHTFAQLKDNPANANADPNNYVVNPLGFLVLKSLRGTPKEVPIVYVDKTGNTNFVIGNVNPSLNYGVVNDFRVGSFNIHAGFEGQRGGQIYNFSHQWMEQDLRAPEMDMTKVSNANCPAANAATTDPVTKALITYPNCQRVAEGFFSGPIYNGLQPSEYFVESGAFLKLSELSAAYNVPTRFLPKVGLGRASGVKLALIGRNLITWTNYSGFDPDITSGGDFNYKIDGFSYPPFRTITGQVEIRF